MTEERAEPAADASDHAPGDASGGPDPAPPVVPAVGVVDFGGPDALRVVEIPERHAGPGQVRIRVLAAAVNPTDTYTRNGARAEMLRKDPPPYVPGMDAAGLLDEIGDGTQPRWGWAIV